MANSQSIAQSPTWMGLTADEVEDLDEPPEENLLKRSTSNFRRTTIRRPSDQQPSLLTKAIMGQSDDETYDGHHDSFTDDRRRRSMASNISVASTADLTSDTGLTSPARTNTPSPPLPEMAVLRFGEDTLLKPRDVSTARLPEAPRKRCIQFACNAKPIPQERSVPMVKTPSAQEATRKPCIKFACPARPASTQNTPPTSHPVPPVALDLTPQARVQPTRTSALMVPGPPSPRQAGFRRLQGRGSAPRPKFLRASSVDLARDGSQFHEFAREMVREDDWIRHDTSVPRTKLTINDTLVKENHIRRLATEAEEEAELEEEDEEAAFDDEDELDEDALDEDEEEYDDDDDEEDEDEEDGADGYSTDEETGFADSDDEEDDDENMILWTPVQHRVSQPTSTLSSKIRRPSLHEQHSDSSTSTASARVRPTRRERAQRNSIAAEAVDLPDSTDFVCGTLDEDRPLEEAYLSCLAARRNEKLRIIPQDIDPSFPASDPENEEEEELYNPVHHSSDDEETWMQGKMEDLDHEQGRARRKKRNDGASPKRYHSPPPRRLHSPAPKARCRSPKPLFEHGSPRRVRSPAPKGMTTPVGSPRHGTNVKFQLAGRPGLVHTKSLPRPAALFPHIRHGRYPKNSHHHADGHVRGAIDIVKGLEKKRQRRKEKFHQKYCDRARRGQIPERKPLPGRGAERMKELGLLMAGKKEQGNYVLSI
ncbi:hypothetical protein HJFPF1_02711 [Paramyrothecium foliicola]|nr:hypothetical protein HJFPF1_02711 [Paramyrothecium foliicola]